MANTLSAADFGVRPGEGNAAQGLREAAAYCRQHPGTTLDIPPGSYAFRDQDALAIMEKALGGEYGNNPEPTLFDPAFPHVIGLDFTGAKGVTVRAEGACIVFDGWYLPVCLDQCESFTLQGLTIDCMRPPYSAGKIIEVGRRHYEAQFDPRYPLREGLPAFCIDFYDAQARRRRGVAHYDARTERTATDVLRIRYKGPGAIEGDYCIVRHSAHGAPAVMIRDATDVLFEDVRIHAHPGMGVVGHRSSNLTFKGLRIVPRAGELVSTNTDATHFTSCSGRIVFDGCQFEGQGDDSTNIHNYYYAIEKRIDETSCRIRVGKHVALHALAPDYPEPGDTLELVERKTLAPVRSYKVMSSRYDAETKATDIAVDAPLPETTENHLLINVSRLPEVVIRNCHIRSHLARGILIKTRKVLIEGCTIENTTGTGIHVGAEGDWHEGAPTADLVIRNNRIIDCGSGHGTQNGACAIAVNVKAEDTRVPGLHKRILIEGNQIVGNGAKRGIFISGAEDVTIRRNQIAECDQPVRVEYSTDVKIYGNYGAGVSYGPGAEVEKKE